MRGKRKYRSGWALAFALLCLGLLAPVAGAVEFKYTLDEDLSLTGDCSTSPPFDEVVDPGCPYAAFPAGPSGRFDQPVGVAVDDWGNQYVASFASGTDGRIDVFDSEGHFITELADPFGVRSIAVDGEGNLYAYERASEPPSIVRYPPTTHNPAAGEIAYDLDDREVIASYVEGSPEISFIFNGLTIDRQDLSDPTDDRLYSAEGNRISIYSSAADGNTLVDRIEPAGLSSASFVAVDAERRLLYTTHCRNNLLECVVWVLDADNPYTFVKEISGVETPQGKFFSAQGKLTIAVDETTGHLFIGDLAAKKIAFELKDDELDGSYEFVSSFEVPNTPAAGGQADVAENLKDPDPDDLNPNDNYRHLYVPLPKASGNLWAFEPPAIGPPEIEGATAVNIGATEAELEAQVKPGELETTYTIEYVTEAQFEIDGFASASLVKTGTLPAVKPPQSISALLSGLIPGESYRFRVFAENEVGDDEGVGTFTTYEDAPISVGSCPNDALRVGPSAALPDCRAYELVTPPGARGPFGGAVAGERFGSLQAAPSGNAMSFELNSGALPGTEASGYFHGDPYLATRSASGWSTVLAGPTGTMSSKPRPGSFSPDQGYSLFTADGDGTLVIDGKPTEYIRYPDGHAELVGRGSIDTDPYALGRLITEGGTHIVFQTDNFEADKAQKLEPDAPQEGIEAVYDRTRDPLTGVEQTHVVSLLPGNIAPVQDALFAGASADGEGIAFTIAGALYFRVHNEETHAIGAGIDFAGIADGGERIFYVEGGDLKAFDADTEEVTVFADTAAEVIPVNVAPQGTRAYFVSESALGGENPNGESATPGEQNLYLSEEGDAITFVATLTERDVEGIKGEGTGAIGHGLGLWTEALARRQPALDPSRLTPDGRVLAFQSQADLDGYEPGEEPQVYRYDDVEGRLHCISCPPTKTAATGGAYLQSLTTFEASPFETPYTFIPALRSDGDRLFFESTEALVAADIDDLRDVYEWEEEGVGSCGKPGGCIYLISSGDSAKNEFLFGNSASGDDVFVYTSDVLVPGNPATVSIYDARVNGGFATKPGQICVGEGCRPDLTPPPPLLPIGVGNEPGNFLSQPKKCPKGKRKVKRKGKVVCIKKKKKNRAAANRGAGR